MGGGIEMVVRNNETLHLKNLNTTDLGEILVQAGGHLIIEGTWNNNVDITVEPGGSCTGAPCP